MQQPHSTSLHRMITSEGAQVLVHRIRLDSSHRTSYRIIRWCSSYWTDCHDGQISGPWTTLTSALRNTPAGALRAGASHNIFCPSLRPDELARIMTKCGGVPQELVVNGEDVGLE